MSVPGLSLAITALEGTGVAFLQSFNGKPARSVAGLVAQVTVEEEHRDELRITDHPVETGAEISDHAYKMPAEVTIRMGWSNSPSPQNTGLLTIPANILNALGATLAAFTGPSSYVQDIYAKLLAIQATRQPFVVVTGKRTYNNMLFRSLAVTTNINSDNSLMVVAMCKEVIMVETQLITVPSSAVMANPEVTGAPPDLGTTHLAPAPNVNTPALDAAVPEAVPTSSTVIDSVTGTSSTVETNPAIYEMPTFNAATDSFSVGDVAGGALQ